MNKSKRIKTVLLSSLLMTVLLILSGCNSAKPSSADSDKAEKQKSEAKWIDSQGNETDKLPIVLYYDGVCAACETEANFLSLMDEELAGLDRNAMSYVAVDTFRDKDWKEKLTKIWPEAETLSVPFVRVGNQFLQGDNAIKEGLRALTHEELGINLVEYTYYYRPDCPDCQEIEAAYEAWKKQPGILVHEANVKDEEHLNALRALFVELDIPEDKWEIPFFIENESKEYWTIDQVDKLLSEIDN